MIERVTRVHVLPKGEPIFCETAYVVEIEDEAAGEFVVISEQRSCELKPGTIAIDPSDWVALRGAIDRMMETIQKEGGVG